jgi:hypothetical protein
MNEAFTKSLWTCQIQVKRVKTLTKEFGVDKASICPRSA